VHREASDAIANARDPILLSRNRAQRLFGRCARDGSGTCPGPTVDLVLVLVVPVQRPIPVMVELCAILTL